MKSNRIKRKNKAVLLKTISSKLIIQGAPFAFSSISTTGGQYDLLTPIVLGLDTYNRVGRAIRLLRFQLTGLLIGGQSNLATDDRYNSVRINLLWGSPSMYAAVLPSLQVPITPQYLPGLLENLHESHVSLRSFSRDSIGYMPAIAKIDFSVNLKSRRVVYGLAAPGMMLTVACLSDSSVPANPGFSNGYMTLWFEDG